MKDKSIKMMRYNIQWTDIAKELNMTQQSLYNWRNGNNTKQHQAIDLAIESIIKNKKEA